MTAAVVELLATSHTPRDALPSSQPVAMQQGWGCQAAMPRLSEVVPGWKVGQENRNPVDREGGGPAGGMMDKDRGIPLHRRKVVRTRAAPAGPHPYLDRFASGMHRPLEGDDASWRKASIQPVPIPDLGHTGIRTKFSTGAGNGFTPNGVMTDTFRTGIHDTIRNLPPPALRDARDMKTRDYARAVRKHRVDPCGGSLLHAHMSSLELDTFGARSPTPFGAGAGAVGSACLRQSSSLGTFRSRFSPPSSPLSTRRAFAGYTRGRHGNNGGSGGSGLGEGGTGGTRGFFSAPAEGRQVLLRRELSSVQLAAGAVAGGGCDTTPPPVGARMNEVDISMEDGIHESSGGVGRGGPGGQKSMRAQQGGGNGSAKASHLGVPLPDAELERRHGGQEGKNRTIDFPRSRQGCDEISAGIVAGRWNSSCGDIKFGDADESALRKKSRARGRRRDRPTGQGKGNAGPEDSRDDLLASPPEPIFSSFDSRSRATSMAAAARTSRKPGSRRHPKTSAVKPRHLKKPFSADSLLSCLLDVRFGNTRDLSPTKPPGQKWDLRTLPAGITAGAISTTAGGWDGLDEAEDLAGMASNDVDPGQGPRGSDFALVCGGKKCDDYNGERERDYGREGPSGSA
eukprot:g10380.t1